MGNRLLAVGLSTALLTSGLAAAAAAPALAGTDPTVEPVVGTPYGGDGLPAAQATGSPTAVAVDGSGDAFVLDGVRIRRIDAGSGVVSTVVGGPVPGTPVDGASPTAFGLPAAGAGLTYGLGADSAGHVTFQSTYVYRTGDDGLLHRVPAYAPYVAVAGDGTTYSSDGHLVYRTDPGGAATLIGGSTSGSTCDACPATSTYLTLTSLAVAPDGSVYLVDHGAVRRIATDGTITTVVPASIYQPSTAPTDGSLASDAAVQAFAVAVGPTGEVFFSDVISGAASYYGLTSDQVLHRLGTGGDYCGLAATAGTLYRACHGLWALPTDGSGSAGQGTAVLVPREQAADGTAADHAYFRSIQSIARTPDGTLLLAAGLRVRDVLADGTLGTLADLSGDYGTLGDIATAPDGSTYAVVGVGPSTPASQRVVRIPAGGGPAVVVAGGGSDDAFTTTEQATLVDLGGYYRGVEGLAVAGDTLYLSVGGRTLEVTGDGIIHPFSTASGSHLLWDAATGSLYAGAATGVVEISADGSSKTVTTTYGGGFGIGSDGSVYVDRAATWSGRYTDGTITRRYPDSASGLVAGSLTDTAAGGLAGFADGVPAVGADLSPRSLLVEPDDGLTFVDQVDLPVESYATVRHVAPGYQPALPTTPTAFSASSPSPGVLQVTVPAAPAGERDCAYTTTDGSLPQWDASRTLVTLFCTNEAVPAGATRNADGSTTLVVRGLPKPVGATGLTPLSGHYALSDTPFGTGSSGTPQTAAVDVTADTTPPAAPAGLSATEDLSDVRITFSPPADQDVDHFVAKALPGTTPPASPADGYALNLLSPAPGQTTVSGYVPVPDPYAPWAVSVWAVDIAGNVSPAAHAVTTPVAVAAPSSLTAGAGLGRATLSWGSDAFGVVLRAAAGATAPAGPADGTAVALAYGTTSTSVTGLATGRDYSYSLFDSLQPTGGSLHYSAPRTLTLHGTTLAVTGAATRLTGSPTVIGGTLRQATGAVALPGRALRLYGRPHGSTGAYSLLSTATTGSTGQVALTVRPLVSTDYLLQFAGAAVHLGTSSAVVTVTVVPRLTLVASRASATAGTVVTLTTAVSPNCHGQRVYLQRYYSGAWHTVTSVLLNSSSKAAFAVRLARGSNYYRVYKPSTTLLKGAYSANLNVKGL